jgi:hypothetical protein
MDLDACQWNVNLLDVEKAAGLGIPDLNILYSVRNCL